MPNFPIGQKYIITAEDIFGPNNGSLKGKTTRTAHKHVGGEHINIPINIMSRYRHITITYDLMFVNKTPVFMTVSRHITFGTAEMIRSRKAVTLLAAIKQVRLAYMKRGFHVTHLLADGEFKPL
jgi:hypothetical protein